MEEEKQKIDKLKYSLIRGEINRMKGKLLTLIDTLIPEGQQNKATKDLVHSIVGETVTHLWRHAIGEFAPND